MISSKKGIGLTAGLLFLSASANATLIDRGNGLIYDDALNLTWMQDANYAGTQGYAHNGAMTWDDAMAWADDLVYQGYDDWRLPTMVDAGNPGCDFALSGTDCGRDVQTTDGNTVYSELASLWFDTLGNPTQGGVLDTGPFLNLQASDFNDFYWSIRSTPCEQMWPGLSTPIRRFSSQSRKMRCSTPGQSVQVT
ncbi:MAG: DUF1566 domain-containing protein [Candidatus Thiodiazotropha sp.]